MTFRNPIYLDLPLLTNVADYYGVDIPPEARVTRRIIEQRQAAARRERAVGVPTDATEELTETYSTPFRPVRFMNDVVDQLLASGDAIDLVSDRHLHATHRQPIQVEGELSLSAAAEIGGLMERFLPLLVAQAAQGATDFDIPQSELANLMLPSESSRGDQLFDLERDGDASRYVIIVNPAHLYGDAVVDDLDGLMTVFGTVDRLLAEGSSMSLERYILPGMSRTVRRSMGSNSIEDLVRSFSQLPGQNVDAAAITVPGPAAVVKPIVIY